MHPQIVQYIVDQAQSQPAALADSLKLLGRPVSDKAPGGFEETFWGLSKVCGQLWGAGRFEDSQVVLDAFFNDSPSFWSNTQTAFRPKALLEAAIQAGPVAITQVADGALCPATSKTNAYYRFDCIGGLIDRLFELPRAPDLPQVLDVLWERAKLVERSKILKFCSDDVLSTIVGQPSVIHKSSTSQVVAFADPINTLKHVMRLAQRSEWTNTLIIDSCAPLFHTFLRPDLMADDPLNKQRALKACLDVVSWSDMARSASMYGVQPSFQNEWTEFAAQGTGDKDIKDGSWWFVQFGASYHSSVSALFKRIDLLLAFADRHHFDASEVLSPGVFQLIDQCGMDIQDKERAVLERVQAYATQYRLHEAVSPQDHVPRLSKRM